MKQVASVETQHSQRYIALVAILAITISLVFGLTTKDWTYFLVSIGLSSLTLFMDQEDRKKDVQS